MDQLKVESPFMRGLIGTIFSRQLTKKLDTPIDLALYNLSVADAEDEKYGIHVDCYVWISKEDLKKLIWKDQNGSGTS